MMSVVLVYWVVISALMRLAETAVSAEAQITALIGATGKGLNQCQNSAVQNALYVVDNKYGFVCEPNSEDKGDLVLSACIVQKTDDVCTVVTGEDLVRIMSLTSLAAEFTAPGGELWKNCETLITKWEENKVSIQAAGIHAITVKWGVLLGEYPNGVFEVVATPRVDNTTLLKEFEYKVLNYALKSVVTMPITDPKDVSKCAAGSADFLIHGSTMYECDEKKAEKPPKFVGCIEVPLIDGVPNLAEKDFKLIAISDMRMLRAVYSNVLFKSTTMRMSKELTEMNITQLCSAIVAAGNLDSIADNLSPEFAPTYYSSYEEFNEDTEKKIWNFPHFKIDGLPMKEEAFSD